MINRKIHVNAIGTSGRLLFSLDFEPWFPEKRYYEVLTSLYQNSELTSMFGEEVCRLFIEEEREPANTERGFYEGMTLSIYPGGGCGKLVDMSPDASQRDGHHSKAAQKTAAHSKAAGKHRWTLVQSA